MLREDEPVTPLEKAILYTLIYADVFNFPLTAAEIHHFLIGLPATNDAIAEALMVSHRLAAHIICRDGYYALRERAGIIDERLARNTASLVLWPIAISYGRLLALIPFVRMAALTGALAVRNAHHASDDIDYLIVTTAGRVWLTRAMIVLVVRLARLRGVEICPNYVLSESALAQEKRDLYMAHEVAQMTPIYNRPVYEALRTANPWTLAYLPNARLPFYFEDETQLRSWQRFLKHSAEWFFGGWLGNRLEDWECRRKLRKFAHEASGPQSSAQLDTEHVKGHFNDYGYPTLQKYQERLVKYGLASVEDTQGVPD